MNVMLIDSASTIHHYDGLKVDANGSLYLMGDTIRATDPYYDKTEEFAGTITHCRSGKWKCHELTNTDDSICILFIQNGSNFLSDENLIIDVTSSDSGWNEAEFGVGRSTFHSGFREDGSIGFFDETCYLEKDKRNSLYRGIAWNKWYGRRMDAYDGCRCGVRMTSYPSDFDLTYCYYHQDEQGVVDAACLVCSDDIEIV